MEKIDWDSIQEKNVLVLNFNERHPLTFLDNGKPDKTEIIDDKTKQVKKVDCYIFKVKDLIDNIEKELSVIQTRLMLKLKEHLPLKNKSFEITKVQFGRTKFDVDFEVSLTK